ncbi:tetraspanin family protein [Onchocerca flexuosa]|uniref:Tetraspanin family protein n=1 Tax=Onchocerca flexuosa TaxID=387005 RepID=A0A238BIV8_9BILA|nr:tetraspanin family protein [Onchocerca flexuosa]
MASVTFATHLYTYNEDQTIKKSSINRILPYKLLRLAIRNHSRFLFKKTNFPTMVHGCGNRTVKFIFFTSNLLICLFGALIFGFSLWANLDKNFALKLEQVKAIHKEEFDILIKYQTSLWILVVIGAFLFLVGFLGCCGAMCENNVLLALFFVIVLILTVVEAGAVIFAITNKDQFKNSLYVKLQGLREEQKACYHNFLEKLAESMLIM